MVGERGGRREGEGERGREGGREGQSRRGDGQREAAGRGGRAEVDRWAERGREGGGREGGRERQRIHTHQSNCKAKLYIYGCAGVCVHVFKWDHTLFSSIWFSIRSSRNLE